MPPRKRSATGSKGTSAAKKAKTTTAAESSNATRTPANDTGDAPAPPRRKRWAKVSGSGNADDSYRLRVQQPARAREYICLCRPPIASEMDDEDDDDDDEDDNEKNDEPPRQRCDGGKTCLCDKLAADHPDHPWTITRAGKELLLTQHVHAQLRCPDNFDMYTFNDHGGYGILEVIQNLMLDFVEHDLIGAEGSWHEQWAVCEALVMFMLHDTADPVYYVDAGMSVLATAKLIGRLFLTMLARLESKKQLSATSEVKNLGAIMALYLQLAADLRGRGVLEDGSDSEDGLSVESNETSWDSYILAYAKKYNITLKGPNNLDELTAGCDNEAKLPTATNDPWGWGNAFVKYVRECRIPSFAFRGQKRAEIGGDGLDITTWSSAERKKYSFNNKDPLGKKEITALKEGMVMQLG